MTRNQLDPTDADRVLATPQENWLTRVCTALAVVLFIGLFLSRSFAQRFDFGMANILTLIMGFSAWLSLTIGLASSRLPRWCWLSVALAPFVVIGVALCFVRVVRFDGELIPQLESRWKVVTAPPDHSQANQVAGIPQALLAPRASDFKQFLGNDRTAVVKGVQLETDWTAHPPKVL